MKNYNTLPYSFFDYVYGNDVPTEQLFVVLFNKLPSKFTNTKKIYNESVFDYLLSIGFVEEMRTSSMGRRSDNQIARCFVAHHKSLIVKGSVYDVAEKDDPRITLSFRYDISRGELEDQLDLSGFEKHEKEKKKYHIQLVKSEMGHMDTEDFDLKVQQIDLELNYGKDFPQIHDTILKRLNTDNDSGIILLHGETGTGKTSYIRHLTSVIDSKDILFIPPSMVEVLSEPSIIPFLMDHKNSVLIIEDAEKVISDREGKGSPAGVSNILNLTDGILGDCLSIQIITTFNMKREKIDQALLRKGRLIAEHRFTKLSVDESNRLLKHLGKDIVVNEKLTLADIYNVDKTVFRSNNETTIGFTK